MTGKANFVNSLGLRSDILVMRGLSEVEEHADRIVLRTPSEPNYWFGNFVIFRDDRIDPDAQMAQFRADFPDAKHLVIAWDAPAPPDDAPLEAFVRRGFVIDRTDTLTLTTPLQRYEPPEGIVLRPLESDSDWEQVIALQHAVGLDKGYGSGGHDEYVRGRFANRRRQVGEGWARWFGAFDGDLLAGDLGIFVGEGVARFQSVETRGSYRGRGICPSLVTVATEWAQDYDPLAVPVIIADSDSAPGRIYRRCGYQHAETTVAVWRKPEDSV